METDITARILQRVERQSQGISATIAKKMPLGPHNAKVSDNEFKAQFAKMTPEQRRQLAEEMGGVENVLEYLDANSPS